MPTFIEEYIEIETNPRHHHKRSQLHAQLLASYPDLGHTSFVDLLVMLDQLKRSSAIRTPLFEQLIYPVLEREIEVGNSQAILVMLQFADRLNSYNIMHQKNDGYSEIALIDRYLQYDPNNCEVLMQKMAFLSKILFYAVHELPSGVLYGIKGATPDQCQKLLECLEEYKQVCHQLQLDRSEDINYCAMHFQGYQDYQLHRQLYTNYRDYMQQHNLTVSYTKVGRKQNGHLNVRRNFEEKVSYVAQRISGMAVDDQAGFLAVDCGLPSDTFNVIVVRDWSVSSQLLASIDRFTKRGFPFAVWAWESDGEQAGIATLLQHGLEHVETNRAMHADLSQIHLSPLHVEGLEIKQVTTALDLLLCGEMIAGLFGDSNEGRQVLAYFQNLCTYPLSMFPAMRYYFGTLHGMVVAVGMLFVGSQTIGIYDLMTRDGYRRKGIGSAMFQHLLKEASTENRRFCVLQASPDGLRIYAKAGFRVTGDVLTFECKRVSMSEKSSFE